MSRLPHALTLCLACAGLGCDDQASPPRADALPDASSVDAGAAPPLWAAGRVAVRVGPEGVRATIDWDGQPALRELTVGFDAAGESWRTLDWPERTWSAGEGWAEGRFTGAPGLPVMVWRLARAGEGVVSALRFEGSGRRVVMDRVITLDGQAEGARALPAEPLPWVTRTSAGPRAAFQRLDGGSVGLAFHAPQGLVAVAEGVTLSARGPRTEVGPGDTLTLPAVTVRFGDGWAPWPGAEAPPPATGWRSGAWGSAVTSALVRRQGDALQDAGLSSPDRLLLLEGLWYAAPGDWRPGLVFPGGLAGLRAAIAPARLALRWPALHSAPDAVLPAERPEVALPDRPGQCGRPACVGLNPALPAARAQVSRSVDAFADDAAVYLSDLPDAAEVGRGARAALMRELRAAAPHLAWLGEVDDDAPRWAGFPDDDPCRAAATTHPWPAQCAGHLSGAAERPPEIPRDLSRERGLAWALVGAGPRAVDPGPIRLAGRAPGAQRVALTLAAISGGPRMLGDDLEDLTLEVAEQVQRLWALPGRRGQPLDAGALDPPRTWAAPGMWAAVNWSAQDVTLALPPGAWRRVWGDGAARGEVSVPAGDAVLLLAEGVAAVVGHGWNRVEIQP